MIVFLGVVVANFYTVLATIRKTSVCLALKALDCSIWSGNEEDILSNHP